MDFSTSQELFMSLPFSQAMKKCIVETNWLFSDFDIASLIYNFPFRKTHSETTKLIETVASLTTDENLKKQIQQLPHGYDFYEVSQSQVISNVQPQFQMGWEFDGYIETAPQKKLSCTRT